MNKNIKKWYLENFPDDDLGQTINENVTFAGLFETLDSYKCIYEYLGEGIDSVIRERCFQELADLMEVDYQYIYEQWLLA